MAYVNLLDVIYPVGSVYISWNATSPATIIGGTWEQVKTFLYGQDSSGVTGGHHGYYIPFDFLDGTQWLNIAHGVGEDSFSDAGAYYNTFTPTSQMAYKVTAISASSESRWHLNKLSTADGKASTQTLPPYTTCYIWHRTA